MTETHTHCMRCGGSEIAVIAEELWLCGRCFLDEALRRRRRLSPAPRWRRREMSSPGTKREAAAAMR